MKRFTLALTTSLLGALALGQERPPAAAPVPAPATRFVPVEIHVDSGARPLAAYQIEFTSESPDVKIVGVEGGAHPAFATPPYYDPAALTHGRIVLAAFNTGKDLPTGKTRVATLHLQVRGAARPDWSVKIEAAATMDGERIPASASAVALP